MFSKHISTEKTINCCLQIGKVLAKDYKVTRVQDSCGENTGTTPSLFPVCRVDSAANFLSFPRPDHGGREWRSRKQAITTTWPASARVYDIGA